MTSSRAVPARSREVARISGPAAEPVAGSSPISAGRHERARAGGAAAGVDGRRRRRTTAPCAAMQRAERARSRAARRASAPRVAERDEHLRDAGRDDLRRQLGVGVCGRRGRRRQHLAGVELGAEHRRAPAASRRPRRRRRSSTSTGCRPGARLLDVASRAPRRGRGRRPTAVPSDGCPANGSSLGHRPDPVAVVGAVAASATGRTWSPTAASRARRRASCASSRRRRRRGRRRAGCPSARSAVKTSSSVKGWPATRQAAARV